MSIPSYPQHSYTEYKHKKSNWLDADILSVANIMNEHFLKFPVSLEFLQMKSQSRFMKCRKEKRVVSMYRNWKSLTESISVEGFDHHGIHTGEKNKITVIDFAAGNEHLDVLDDIKTLKVETPSGGVYCIFHYEEKLHSIYNALNGVSILNDNNCIFFGRDYNVLNSHPVAKMPETLFDTLYKEQQERPESIIDQKFYELFSILGYEWFNDYDLIMKLIHVLRNEFSSNGTSHISIIRKLLVERSDMYHELLLIRMYGLPMNYKQQRFGTCALTKIIKKGYPIQYEEWLRKWDPKKLSRAPKLIFKEGSLVKLSDITKRYKNMNAEKLLKLNSNFTISRKNICKSCLQHHIAKCCSKYQRTAHTTCQFVNNISLM